MMHKLIIIVLMTMLGSVAALFLKKASGKNSILMILRDKNLYLGGGLYFISSLLNIYLLNIMKYSVVLPLTSITYIWTMIISFLILKEKISIRMIIGVMCIISGAILAAL